MPFFCRSSSIVFPYFVMPLNRVGNSIRNLGFIFTHNLSPIRHIEAIFCKFLKLHGFTSCITQDFRLMFFLKSIYCSLIRSILEYSYEWYECVTAALEKIQKKFLRLVAFHLNITYPLFIDFSTIIQLCEQLIMTPHPLLSFDSCT